MTLRHEYLPLPIDYLDATTSQLRDCIRLCHENIKALAEFIEPYVGIELYKQKTEIYKILKTLNYIDITEEEFLNLFKKDNV